MVGSAALPPATRTIMAIVAARTDEVQSKINGRGAAVHRESNSKIPCDRLARVLETLISHVIGNAQLLEMRHDGANDVVELGHARLLDASFVFGIAHPLVFVIQVCDDVHSCRVKPDKKWLAVSVDFVDEGERDSENRTVDVLHVVLDALHGACRGPALRRRDDRKRSVRKQLAHSNLQNT